MAKADDEFRKLAAELAKDQARKAITRTVFGDEDEEEEEDEEEVSWIKRGIAVILGGLTLLWMLDWILRGIIPFVEVMPFVFAVGAISWSLNQWGVRPIKALRRWRAARLLKKEEKEKAKALTS